MDTEQVKKLIKDGRARPEGEYQVFGVLVPLIDVEGGCRVLLETRASTLKKQPGEISLPGGRKEEDETPLGAAIRETSEELNIPEEAVSVFGPLDYLVTPFNYIIYPFVGEIKRPYVDRIKGAPDEVDEVFTVPLDFFLKTKPECYRVATKLQIPRGFPFELIPKGEGYNWSSGTYQVCFYCYNGRIIWGVTARILKNLAHRLTDNEQRA